jgi:hypothetical protein
VVANVTVDTLKQKMFDKDIQPAKIGDWWKYLLLALNCRYWVAIYWYIKNIKEKIEANL